MPTPGQRRKALPPPDVDDGRSGLGFEVEEGLIGRHGGARSHFPYSASVHVRAIGSTGPDRASGWTRVPPRRRDGAPGARCGSEGQPELPMHTHCMLHGNPKGATERLAAFFSHHEVTATDRARRPKPTDARPLPRSRRRKSGSNMRKSICRLTSRVLRFHQMNHRVLSMCGLALSLFGDEKGCSAAALEPRRRPGAVHQRVEHRAHVYRRQ